LIGPAKASPAPRRILAAILGLGCLIACDPPRPSQHEQGVRRYQGQGAPGAEEGLWTTWYFDGQMRSRGHYSGGLKLGIWETWYRNGQRESQGERVPVQGTRVSLRGGTWTYWHEGSGRKKSEGRFQAGRREGPWFFWKNDGSVDEQRTGNYVNSELTDTKDMSFPLDG
jgi:hypothetical protein